MKAKSLLLVRTAQRQFVIDRRSFQRAEIFGSGHTPTATKPLLVADLGTTIEPNSPSLTGRRYALFVELRRRIVLFLVAELDQLPAELERPFTPLEPWLRQTLNRQWVEALLLTDGEPLLVLDLQRIASDLTLGLTLAPPPT